ILPSSIISRSYTHTHTHTHIHTHINPSHTHTAIPHRSSHHPLHPLTHTHTALPHTAPLTPPPPHTHTHTHTHTNPSHTHTAIPRCSSDFTQTFFVCLPKIQLISFCFPLSAQTPPHTTPSSHCHPTLPTAVNCWLFPAAPGAMV